MVTSLTGEWNNELTKSRSYLLSSLTHLFLSLLQVFAESGVNLLNDQHMFDVIRDCVPASDDDCAGADPFVRTEPGSGSHCVGSALHHFIHVRIVAPLWFAVAPTCAYFHIRTFVLDALYTLALLSQEDDGHDPGRQALRIKCT